MTMPSIREKAKDKTSIAIAGHVNPDGDCVGSCLGMYNYLIKTFPDKQVDVFLEPIRDIFAFLPHAADIKNPHEYVGEEVSLTLPVEKYDLFIVLDCADGKRLGPSLSLFEAADHTLCIDHHVSNNDFADENFVVSDASSTAELVGNAIDLIDKDIAECLYVGITHDTGVFQYGQTTSDTMNLAGKCMDTGIDFSRILSSTFYEKTYAQNRIMGLALVKAKLFDNDRIIASYITAAEEAEYGVEPADFEGVVAQLRNTKEADAAIFLYANKDGYKVSTRAAGAVDLSKIAVSFGGGGHENAAGFTVSTDDPEALIEKIVKKIHAGWR